MKKKILLLLLTLLTSIIYASGFALPEQGAKAISMGNAFTAVADDASALFNPPARCGITFRFSFLVYITSYKWLLSRFS